MWMPMPMRGVVPKLFWTSSRQAEKVSYSLVVIEAVGVEAHCILGTGTIGLSKQCRPISRLLQKQS